MATVTALLTYPVKGCAPTHLTSSTLTDAGLPHDRSFLITNPDGLFRSQRTHPAMAAIRPTVDGDALVLSAPDAGELRFGVTYDGPRVPVSMFKLPYKAIDQGDAAAAWVSEVLKAPCRLVRVPPDHDRVSDGLTPGTSGFADSTAVLMASTESMDDLNARMEAPLPIARFRPNIVVSGLGAFAEDRVRSAAIGEARLGYAKLAVRCVVTTVDQEAGVKTGPEPLKTLATFRRIAAGGVVFGSKFAVTRTGAIAVGDEVVVEEWGEAEY